MKVGDAVRVTARRKEIGTIVEFVRGSGRNASVMVKLNRAGGDGYTHVVVFAYELEPV